MAALGIGTSQLYRNGATVATSNLSLTSACRISRHALHTSPNLPIIDLSDPLSSSTKSKLHAAAQKFGAFYVTYKTHAWPLSNLPLSPMQAADTLFALPSELKLRNAVDSGGSGFTRGYVGVGEESGSEVLEWKEAFSYGYEWANTNQSWTNSLEGDNVWPEKMFGVKETLLGIQSAMVGVALTLCGNLHPSMKYEGDARATGEAISFTRVFRYYPLPPELLSKPNAATGSSVHTDWGALTVIYQDENRSHNDCLQMLHKDDTHGEKWISAPAIERTFFVNVGDYTSLLSKGQFHSPLHRVLPPPAGSSPRTSYVMFYYPAFNTPVPETEVAEGRRMSLLEDQRVGAGSSGNGKSARTFGEYITMKWSEVYRPRTE
ncbi:hypothetical protein BJ742DRAFT_839879 [Cladochytrium replicatum]|nr:hypothetical protein BJ742DRAFT_839879 [Cladochytrium replicatum]